MNCRGRRGAAWTILLLASCLILVVSAVVQLLTMGVCAWRQEVGALALDNNGAAACRALRRDCNFQLLAINIASGRHGVEIIGDGVCPGREYQFFCQPSPENGRPTIYRSVSVNYQPPGVNPLTDPNSVEVVAWQAQRLAYNVVQLRFTLREIRWGKECDYNVLLKAYNAKTTASAKDPF